MNKQLIELAKEKGFESYFMKLISFICTSDHVITNHEFVNYSWLCELQKWLREKHSIFISIEYYNAGVFYTIQTSSNKVISQPITYGYDKDAGFISHEEALGTGLLESLKLIP